MGGAGRLGGLCNWINGYVGSARQWKLCHGQEEGGKCGRDTKSEKRCRILSLLSMRERAYACVSVSVCVCECVQAAVCNWKPKVKTPQPWKRLQAMPSDILNIFYKKWTQNWFIIAAKKKHRSKKKQQQQQWKQEKHTKSSHSSSNRGSSRSVAEKTLQHQINATYKGITSQ